MTAPVLHADGARIAVGGATAIARLTLTTSGTQVVVGGDSAALISALTGVAPAAAPSQTSTAAEGAAACVVAGTLELCGLDVARADHLAAAGLAPCDPPLPPAWTIRDYLSWAGRLSGMTRPQARSATAAALERIGWTTGTNRPLRSLGRAERRTLVLAQALVGAPQVLVCESPLAGLTAAEAGFVGQALARACAGRAALVSVARLTPPGPESELTRTASDVCVLRAGALLAHAAPGSLLASGLVAELSVRRHADALSAELSAQGAVLHGGPVNFAVTLPRGMTLTDLLAVAARVEATVVRLVPLVG